MREIKNDRQVLRADKSGMQFALKGGVERELATVYEALLGHLTGVLLWGFATGGHQVYAICAGFGRQRRFETDVLWSQAEDAQAAVAAQTSTRLRHKCSTRPSTSQFQVRSAGMRAWLMR